MNNKRFLIRKLTITTLKGETDVLPLIVVSCTLIGLTMTDVEFSRFEKETEGVSYLNEMCIREDSEGFYLIEKILE